MYMTIRKRTVAVMAVTAVLTILGLCAGVIALDLGRKNRRKEYEADQAAAWRQSVAELSGALSDLETNLQKGLYASGDYQAVSWAARVFSDAGAARTALETLPVYELRLQGTETFLNQVGEFTLEMARKQMRGETLTEAEESSLKTLALRSQELADEVLAMAEKIADENPGYEAMQELLLPSQEGADKTDFESLEDIFAGDAPLNYDGEHSAWRENRTSDWLKTLPETGKKELKRLAAKYLGVDDGTLTEESHYETPFLFWEFRNGDTAVAVTGRGGMLYGLTRLRQVEERKLSVEQALTMGQAGLAELGYGSMEPVSWQTAENTLTAVFVLRQKGVLVYSDRITLTVALDDGEILTLNAVEYLLAHDPDRSKTAAVSKEEAAGILRKDLTVEALDLVSVPGGDGSEDLCWQFTVRGESDGRVMIFVNANSKVEEEILILLEDEERRTAV